MQTANIKRPFAPPTISTSTRRRRNKPAAPPKPDGHSPQRSVSLQRGYSGDPFARARKLTKSPPPTPPRLPVPHHKSADCGIYLQSMSLQSTDDTDLPPRPPQRQQIPTQSVCSNSRPTFSANNSARTAPDDMEIIDESKTASKADANLTAEIVRNYSGESLYSSEDDLDAVDDNLDDELDADNIVLGTFSPSISASQWDRAQKYKHFGPKIKLSANSSMRDDVRYHNALDIETTNRYRRGHGRGGVDGYGSDQSDESISRVSQSYGAYLYDKDYQANLHKMHSRPLKFSQFQFCKISKNW